MNKNMDNNNNNNNNINLNNNVSNSSSSVNLNNSNGSRNDLSTIGGSIGNNNNNNIPNPHQLQQQQRQMIQMMHLQQRLNRMNQSVQQQQQQQQISGHQQLLTPQQQQMLNPAYAAALLQQQQQQFNPQQQQQQHFRMALQQQQMLKQQHLLSQMAASRQMATSSAGLNILQQQQLQSQGQPQPLQNTPSGPSGEILSDWDHLLTGPKVQQAQAQLQPANKLLQQQQQIQPQQQIPNFQPNAVQKQPLQFNTFITKSQFDALYNEFLAHKQLELPKPPTFSSKPLDLYQFFVTVMQLGGVDIVHERKLWKTVMKWLNFDMSMTSGGFTLNKHYRMYLYDFERYYFAHEPEFLSTGRVSLPKPSREQVANTLNILQQQQAYHQQVYNTTAAAAVALPTGQMPIQHQQQSQMMQQLKFQQQQLQKQQQLMSSSSHNLNAMSPNRTVDTIVDNNMSKPSSSFSPTEFLDPAQQSSSSGRQNLAKRQSSSGSSSATKFIWRTVDTFGGFDVEKLNFIYRGDGEAQSKKFFSIKEDLGKFDWEIIRLALQSSLYLEQLNALRTLLVISNDPSFIIDLSVQTFLLNCLVDLWDKSLKDFQSIRTLHFSSTSGGVDDVKRFFWSYYDLFQLEQEIVEDLYYGPFSNSLQFPLNDGYVYTKSKSSDLSMDEFKTVLELKRLMEFGLLVGTCFRNMVQSQANAMHLSKSSSFLSVFMKWLEFQPEFSPNDPHSSSPSHAWPLFLAGKQFTITDLHITYCAHRKNSLAILQCLSPYLAFNDENEVELTLNILLDFIYNPFFSRYASTPSYSIPDISMESSTNLPIESMLLPVDDLYLLSAMESLVNFLSYPEFRRLCCKFTRQLIGLVTAFGKLIPLGFTQKIVNNNSRQSLQPFYEINLVQMAVRALFRLTQVPCPELLNVCGRSAPLIRILVRLSSGFAWINTPFYSSDVEFRNSALGLGITSISDRTTAQEKELIQEVFLVVSKNSGRALKNILKHLLAQKTDLTEAWRLSRSRLQALWNFTERSKTEIDLHLEVDFSYTTNASERKQSKTNDFCYGNAMVIDDIEMSLMGMALNKRLPADMSELMAELVYIVGQLKR